MACSVGSSGAAVGLTTFPVFEGLTTEGSLVNLSVFCPGEGYTEVFKLSGTNPSVCGGPARNMRTLLQ
jgi:hypothetical protein